MKERPSRPTRAPGSLAWWFLPGPPLQNMRALPAAAVRRSHYPPPPPLLFTSLFNKGLAFKIRNKPPPPILLYLGPSNIHVLLTIESFCNRPTLILIFKQCKYFQYFCSKSNVCWNNMEYYYHSINAYLLPFRKQYVRKYPCWFSQIFKYATWPEKSVLRRNSQHP